MNYTPKQLKILRIIKKSTEERGYSPTYSEIAKVMDTSPVTVFEHIAALQKKGAIRRRKYEARSLEIIDLTFDMTDPHGQREINEKVKPFVDLLVKIKNALEDSIYDPDITAGIDSLLAQHQHLIGGKDEQ